MSNKIIICLIIFCLISLASSVPAREYRAAIKDMPAAKYYIALTKAIAEVTGNRISIQVVPFARTEFLLINGKVDIIMPQVKPINKLYNPDLDFASVSLFVTPFVFYSNKSQTIDIHNINKNAASVIETDPTLINFFDIKCSPTNNLERSFDRLSNNRIDGFIMSQFSGDTLLQKKRK